MSPQHHVTSSQPHLNHALQSCDNRKGSDGELESGGVRSCVVRNLASVVGCTVRSLRGMGLELNQVKVNLVN